MTVLYEAEVPSSDNTALFKARVRMLKLKPRTEPVDLAEEKSAQNVSELELVSNSDTYALHAAHARQICLHTRELRDLVLEKRKAYLLSSVNAYGHDNFMSDNDRRQFDHDTELAMKQCHRLVRALEEQVERETTLRREDEYPHLKAVIFLLSLYLRNVCHMVGELRAVQLKRAQHMNKICRLGNLVNKYGREIDRVRRENKAKREELARRRAELEQSKLLPTSLTVKAEPADAPDSQSAKEEEEDGWADSGWDVDEEPTSWKSAGTAYGSAEPEEEKASALEPALLAQLTVENERVYEKFSQQNTEIELIESQVAEIQKLQRTFADKVVEQEKDIEIIQQKTIYTLDNLDQANEFIRDAIKNSASRRVIALFCLIVLTFTLLFLDWYNP